MKELLKKSTGVEIHGDKLRITFQYNGQRCRETLNFSVTKGNIKKAVTKRAVILHEISLGSFNYIEHFPNSRKARNTSSGLPTNTTMRELVERFRDLRFTEISEDSARRYDYIIDFCLNIIGEDRVVSRMTELDVELFRSSLINAVSSSTASYYWGVMSPFFDYAYKAGLNRKKLTESIKSIPIRHDEPDPFSVDEIKMMLSSCKNVNMRLTIVLGFYTGLRVGEMRALCWEDIDFERNTITVSRNITNMRTFKLPKTGKSREVKFPEIVYRFLSEHFLRTGVRSPIAIEKRIDSKKVVLEKVRPVFVPAYRVGQTNNDFYSTTRLTALFKETTAKSGVRHRRLYQLRHSFACMTLNRTGNIAWIASQLGHSNFEMLAKVYGKWLPENSDKEAKKVWEQMEEGGDFDILPH